MGFVIYLALELRRHVGIDRRRRQRCMAEKHLDRLEVHAILQPVSRDRMADGVGRDPLG